MRFWQHLQVTDLHGCFQPGCATDRLVYEVFTKEGVVRVLRMGTRYE